MGSKIGRPIRDNIGYYRHETTSHTNAKFVFLRERYGWEGEGRFWALNNMIGQASGCKLPVGKKFQLMSYAKELDMTTDEFQTYLEFLINDCELIIKDGDIIYTNDVQEIYLELKKKSNKNSSYYNSTKEFQPTESGISATERQLKVDLNIQKIDPFTEEIQVLCKDIMKFWELSEMNNFNQMREITSFLNVLSHNGRFEYFKEQFSAYKKQREKAKIQRHNLKRFIGTISEGYEDGAWTAENWKSKLAEIDKNAKNEEPTVHRVKSVKEAI